MARRTSVTLHAPLARRLPDPSLRVGGEVERREITTYEFRVPAGTVPAGIPLDANPREPNTNRQVYKKVRDSLLGIDGTPTGAFHLKHGGLVIVADEVKQLGKDSDEYKIYFDPDRMQGVVNGGHSYALLRDAIEAAGAGKVDPIPPEQFVELKVHVGVPEDLVPDLADGLNTSMQVRAESLADLRERFDWLKAVLDGHPGAEAISWHEGDDGESQYGIREVLARIMAMDPERYPLNEPTGLENTYARVANVFSNYLSTQEQVERFAPIASEALSLYDQIRYEAVDIWNATSGKFRALQALADRRLKSTHKFPFLLDENGVARERDVRLSAAAAMPCYAAFRVLVEVPDDGPVHWVKGFDYVQEIWRTAGHELLAEVRDEVLKNRGNAHYAARTNSLYRTTTRIVQLEHLTR